MSKGITNSMEMDQPFYCRKKADPVPFSKFMYNSEEGTVFGRTGSSWGKKDVYNVWVNINGLSRRKERILGEIVSEEEGLTQIPVKSRRLIIQVWCLLLVFHLSGGMFTNTIGWNALWKI